MFCLHVCSCTMFTHCPQRTEEGVGSPGTGVIGGWEPPFGCWQYEEGLLQNQVLLMAKPPLQSPVYIFLKWLQSARKPLSCRLYMLNVKSEILSPSASAMYGAEDLPCTSWAPALPLNKALALGFFSNKVMLYSLRDHHLRSNGLEQLILRL